MRVLGTKTFLQPMELAEVGASYSEIEIIIKIIFGTIEINSNQDLYDHQY